jgi:hypothetical protein
MAQEYGLMEHAGKTIPREVKSLADRIRKDQPDKDDEYAYRTAWDIFRSHTAEGKSYPHKSPESGLKSEGGGTGPIEKQSAVEGSPLPIEHFWFGFEKEARRMQPAFVPQKLMPHFAPAQSKTQKIKNAFEQTHGPISESKALMAPETNQQSAERMKQKYSQFLTR